MLDGRSRGGLDTVLVICLVSLEGTAFGGFLCVAGVQLTTLMSRCYSTAETVTAKHVEAVVLLHTLLLAGSRRFLRSVAYVVNW